MGPWAPGSEESSWDHNLSGAPARHNNKLAIAAKTFTGAISNAHKWMDWTWLTNPSNLSLVVT